MLDSIGLQDDAPDARPSPPMTTAAAAAAASTTVRAPQMPPPPPQPQSPVLPPRSPAQPPPPQAQAASAPADRPQRPLQGVRAAKPTAKEAAPPPQIAAEVVVRAKQWAESLFFHIKDVGGQPVFLQILELLTTGGNTVHMVVFSLPELQAVPRRRSR